MGWFSSKKEVVSDLNVAIDPCRQAYLERYERDLNYIENTLRVWMAHESHIASSINTPIGDSLPNRLVKLDLKYLPLEESIDELGEILTDTFVSKAYTRFLDVIARIQIRISQETIVGLKQKFLYAITQTTAMPVNGLPVVTEDDWKDLLQVFPWVIFIPILQEIYDGLVIEGLTKTDSPNA